MNACGQFGQWLKHQIALGSPTDTPDEGQDPRIFFILFIYFFLGIYEFSD